MWDTLQNSIAALKKLVGLKPNAQNLSNNELSKVIRTALTKVKAEDELRVVAASSHSDEEIFKAVLALSDESFELIASKIRPLNAFEEEKGSKWHIMNDAFSRIETEVEPLRRMGLFSWHKTNEGAYMNFNQRIVHKRLAARHDLIERIKNRARENKSKLIIY